MKNTKTNKAIITLLLTGVFFTGCNKDSSSETSKDKVETTKQTVVTTEAETENAQTEETIPPFAKKVETGNASKIQEGNYSKDVFGLTDDNTTGIADFQSKATAKQLENGTTAYTSEDKNDIVVFDTATQGIISKVHTITHNLYAASPEEDKITMLNKIAEEYGLSNYVQTADTSYNFGQVDTYGGTVVVTFEADSVTINCTK